MDLKEKIKTTVKNIEGKVQEAVGDLTHNPEAQAEGQKKQAEAKSAEEHQDTKSPEDEEE